MTFGELRPGDMLIGNRGAVLVVHISVDGKWVKGKLLGPTGLAQMMCPSAWTLYDAGWLGHIASGEGSEHAWLTC